MKVLTLSIILLSFFSVAARGQLNPERRTSEPLSSPDPFSIWEMQARALDGGWSDNNQSGRDWKDKGAGSTVSVKELQHKVPKAAIKEYNKGIQALNDGRLGLAKQHLENAISIDRDFADAHNNLGVTVGYVGQTSQAIEEFQKAIELSPRNTAALSNLSVALYFQGRYHEVCQIARRSLNLDPRLLQVRYVFGLSLIADRGDANEAVANLDRAAQQYPEAHIAASNLLVKVGQRNEAAQRLEAYLQSAPSGDPRKPQVQARLAELRQ